MQRTLAAAAVSIDNTIFYDLESFLKGLLVRYTCTRNGGLIYVESFVVDKLIDSTVDQVLLSHGSKVHLDCNACSEKRIYLCVGTAPLRVVLHNDAIDASIVVSMATRHEYLVYVQKRLDSPVICHTTSV